MIVSYIKLYRSADTLELLHDPNAFSLLTLVAVRALRAKRISLHNLKLREALVGDHKACGLTEGQYREAKKRLIKLGLATFKGTNKGTIATILNSTIYDINLEDDNDQQNIQRTNGQRTCSERTTTNKNSKNIKNEKKRIPPSPQSSCANENQSQLTDELWENLSEEEQINYAQNGAHRWSALSRQPIQHPLSLYYQRLGKTELALFHRNNKGKGESQ